MVFDIKFCLTYATVAYILINTVHIEALPLGYDPYTARDSRLNAYLKSVLDPIKQQMKTGNPKFGIPIVDPLSIGNISQSFNADAFNVTVFAQDLTIMGLSNFSLHKLVGHLSNLTFDIKVVFPKVIVTTEQYLLNGTAMDILPLVGDGRASIHVNDVEVDVSVTFSSPSSGRVKIENITLDVDFGRVSAFLEDLLGGGSLGEFVNYFLSAQGKNYYLLYKPAILEKATVWLIEKANKKLSTFDLKSLMS